MPQLDLSYRDICYGAYLAASICRVVNETSYAVVVLLQGWDATTLQNGRQVVRQPKGDLDSERD